jgi:hypothetical protein
MRALRQHILTPAANGLRLSRRAAHRGATRAGAPAAAEVLRRALCQIPVLIFRLDNTLRLQLLVVRYRQAAMREGAFYFHPKLSNLSNPISMTNFCVQRLKREQAIIRLSRATRCRGAAGGAAACIA